MTTQLSMNQATTRGYSLPDTAEALSAAGISAIGLWIEPVDEIGIDETKTLLADNGLSVSSICRVGFVAGKHGTELAAAHDTTKRAIDMAAEVGSPMVTFIAGGLPAGDKNLPAAALRVRDSLEELVPYAQNAGVVLALEPIHPLFASDRSVVTTVAQALDLIADLPATAAGVLIDTYAVWWDPRILESLARAGERIAGFQVSDFGVPLSADNMNSRLMIGDGCIDFRTLVKAAQKAGYKGPIEAEIFNNELWTLPLNMIVHRTVEAFAEHVALPTD